MRTLYIARDLKAAVWSDTRPEVVTLADWFAGDVEPIAFYLLEPRSGATPLSTALYSIVAPGSYSLQIGLYKSDGTELAYQGTFTEDLVNNRRLGELNLDTAAITAALGSAASISVIFGCKITEGTNLTTVYRADMTLRKAIVPATGTATPPGEVAATQNWCLQTFLKLVGSQGFILYNTATPPDKACEVTVGTDGQLNDNPITL